MGQESKTVEAKGWVAWFHYATLSILYGFFLIKVQKEKKLAQVL